MKINLWPLDNNIATKDINYKNVGTEFHVDIKYQEEGGTYHIAQQFIDLCGLDEDLDNRGLYPVNYSGVSFSVDSADLGYDEITNILVNFLAHYKLYLHHFSISERETYVSYASPETESDKAFDLTYEPSYRRDAIFIDAEVQREDGVDYYDLLDIKIKNPIKIISDEELEKLGYKFHEYGIYSFAILSDEDAREHMS